MYIAVFEWTDRVGRNTVQVSFVLEKVEGIGCMSGASDSNTELNILICIPHTHTHTIYIYISSFFVLEPEPMQMMGQLKDMGNADAESKMEQFQKLKQLESRLKKLQEDQMKKEENYQERIRSVMVEME